VLRGRAPERDAELRRVFDDHAPAVYAVFAYSVDASTAEDLTSATFEKVIRNWRRYDAAKASERTWILAIARNTLVDHFRRQSHRDAASIDEHPVLIETLATGDDFAQRHLDTDELRSWLAFLSDREREILALRYGADLPAADIAALLELTSDNVHQIISRALRRLRKEVQGAE
jgi:RNA polymerase sigma-70 factor (ECF subfamily)